MQFTGGTIYAQDNGSGSWYSWSGAAFFGPTAPPPITGSVTDSSGNIWTINTSVNNGEVYQNGIPPNGQVSSNVIEIALVAGVIWHRNASAQWYSWSGTAWVGGGNPSITPALPTPTALVIAGSGGSFTDLSSNVWTINSGQVLRNGSSPATSSGVVQIALVGGVVWYENSSGNWYSWSGTAWTTTGVAPIVANNYFNINDNYVILDGLQFQSPTATAGGAVIGGIGANLSIQQCIIDAYAQPLGASPISVSGANLSLTNSLIVGRNTSVGGAMVNTLGATGAAVANNTFVHTSLVTGQVVLDAGSNTTAASATSTNNIFYNYGTVYI
jgi:hypothetical protein